MPRKGMSARKESSESWQNSGYIQIGGVEEGKKTKTEFREEAKANGAKNSHEIASQTPITTVKTFERYNDATSEFISFGRAHGYGHNVYAFPSKVVSEFLTEKIGENKSWETMKVYCSALNKYDDALNAVDGGKRDWSPQIQEMRDIARETSPRATGETRRFNNPQSVIDNLISDKAKLVAELQLTYGFRVNDALTIRINPNDTLFIRSKAGFRVPQFQISPEHAAKLRELSNGRAVFTIMPYKSYLSELKAACAKCGEHYSGSHSFRYNFARALYESEIAKGKSPTAAKAVVSEALFHRRLEIVERYIK